MSDEPPGHENTLYDPCGQHAWKAAREAARANGRDLSPLTDMHPYDRERRLADLARSDIPGERELAARTFAQDFLDALGTEFLDTLSAAIRETVHASQLPDIDWSQQTMSGGRIVMASRQNGHVLVVYQSGSTLGGYYPVVDGFHLSARDSPATYVSLLDAMIAAMAAAGVSSRTSQHSTGATP